MFTIDIYNQPLMVTIGGCKYCIFKRSSSLDKCDKSRKGCYHLELSELVIYRHNRLDILKLGYEFTTAKRLCRTRNLYIHWPSWKGNLYHPLYSSFTKIILYHNQLSQITIFSITEVVRSHNWSQNRFRD